VADRMRAGRALPLLVAAILALGAVPATASPAAGAADRVTALVIDGRPVADGSGAVTSWGTGDHVSTTWSDGDSTWQVAISAPAGAQLQPGTFPLSATPTPTAGSLVIISTFMAQCGSGEVTILEGPAYSAEFAVVTFAADWVSTSPGCTSGSIRIGALTPSPLLRSTPEIVDFGPQVAGVAASRNVDVRNAGNTTIGITGATIGPRSADTTGDTDFTVTASTCTANLPPAATCVLTVTMAPEAQGARQGRLTFATAQPAWGGTVDLLASVSIAAAQNDAIADAAEISSLPYTYYGIVSGATTDRLDPVCDGGYRHSVWFHLRLPAAGPVTITTDSPYGDGPQADSVLAVYDGTAPDALSPVVCGDNLSDEDLRSRVRFPALADHDYWVSVTEGQTGSLSGLVLHAAAGTSDTTVDVSGWAASPTGFYPYPDGYRDTVLTKATLAEPADVSVDVVATAAPTKVLRHVVLGRREATYGWRWDGKTNGGTIVAAGTYLLRHRYTDVFGNTATHDVPVTVSAKRLTWLTTTAVLNGSRFYDRYWSDGNGRAAASGTSLVLKSSTGSAYAVYRFTLGSAIAYRSVRFEVVGKSTTGRKATLSIWDTDMGGWSWATRIGPAYGTWRLPTVTAGNHVYGRYAYGKVEVRNTSGAVNWVISKARLTYTYAVLR